ncbi:MAG: DNA-binding response regulator [Verrucomicrobia bacterium]|nr:MAG: DNA-binding response regulator [Verrucomicrobiota bacterium]
MKPTPVPETAATAAITVWLVEDNRSFSRALTRVLGRAEGVTCARVFSTAEDLLEALADQPGPDVLLMDVQLPGRSGLEVLPAIREASPKTRVVMLTVFDDPDKVFRAVCAGASGYLLKTATAERIVESIREASAGGAPMHPQVARLVLDQFARLNRPRHDAYHLTPRERHILELMTEGLTKKEIAARLDLSFHTVDTHLRNIYAKLHVHNSSGAVAKALRERLF